MDKRIKLGLLSLIVGMTPMTQVDAAVSPEMMKRWQAMNQKLIKMQTEMVQMQKDMTALTEAMLLAEGEPSRGNMPSPVLQNTGTTSQPVALETEGIASSTPIASDRKEVAQGVTVRTQAVAKEPAIEMPGKNYSTKDLENMGMGLEAEAARTDTSINADEDKKSEGKEFTFNGEVRLGYLLNRGGDNDRFRSNDSQIRVRLYGNQKLNEDWGVHGMLEGQKHFLDNSRTDLTSGSRIYVEGLTGINTITAGKFGYLMGEGNIYDSEFRGIRTSIKANPWTYTAAAGRTGDGSDTMVGTASFAGDNYDLEGGIYKFGDDDNNVRASNTILAAGGNYYWDHFRLGAMWLCSDDDQDTTGQNGYVLSSRYRTMKSWKPNSWSLYANYYNQPWTTYRNHTMNGMGNTLHGFKGYSVGLDYSLAPEVVLNLEYYKLTDKSQGDTSSTVWSSVSYSF